MLQSSICFDPWQKITGTRKKARLKDPDNGHGNTYLIATQHHCLPFICICYSTSPKCLRLPLQYPHSSTDFTSTFAKSTCSPLSVKELGFFHRGLPLMRAISSNPQLICKRWKSIPTPLPETLSKRNPHNKLMLWILITTLLLNLPLRKSREFR
jgi:hypothetical protein